MKRRPPRDTRTDTLLPYTALCRSENTPPALVMLVVPRRTRTPPVVKLPHCDNVLVSSRLFEPSKTVPAKSSKKRWSPVAVKSWSCDVRSEEHTSELQSLMRISYAVFCLTKKKTMQLESHNEE